MIDRVEVFEAPHATKWGGAQSFTLVRMYVRTSVSVILCSTCTVLVSATLPTVFDAGTLKTYNIVQICIEHVHKGNRNLIQVIMAELCPILCHTNFKHITLWYYSCLRNSSYSISCKVF